VKELYVSARKKNYAVKKATFPWNTHREKHRQITII
jgi:hypothetical protein